MPKERERVIVGRCHTIEFAERLDRTKPARIFLDQLKSGTWDNPEDPDDGEQVTDYHKLLDMCAYFARHGCHRRSYNANYLRSGLWEFKRGNKRISWYDVDDDGRHSPKTKRDTPQPGVPLNPATAVFDKYIRLGHCFPKTGETTETFDLVEAAQVRSEDLSHD